MFATIRVVVNSRTAQTPHDIIFRGSSITNFRKILTSRSNVSFNKYYSIQNFITVNCLQVARSNFLSDQNDEV